MLLKMAEYIFFFWFQLAMHPKYFLTIFWLVIVICVLIENYDAVAWLGGVEFLDLNSLFAYSCLMVLFCLWSVINLNI